MTSATEKERIRRQAIEAEWAHPDPIRPRHVAEEDERPAAAQRLIDLVDGDPVYLWTVQEYASTVYGEPRWRRLKPTDPLLSYVADPVTVYQLGLDRLRRDGLNLLFPEAKQDHEHVGRLMAVHLVYTDGKPTTCRVGRQQASGRLLGEKVAANRIGVVVREGLAP